MLGPQPLSKSDGSTTPLTTRHLDKLWKSYVKSCDPSITLVLHYVWVFFFIFLISHYAREFIKNSINKWNGKILKE